MVRIVMTVAAAVAVFLAAGCTAGQGDDAAAPARSPASLPDDGQTAAALLKIATAFNDEYGSGDYGPVYARWDARSQAIISEADYIRRHKDCPGSPQPPARTETAAPGAHGAWMVRYEIGGQQPTDYWFYVHRPGGFDLVSANPERGGLDRCGGQGKWPAGAAPPVSG